MTTANQINYRLGQAKKKLAKLNKEVTATKANIKKLESALKKAKAEAKAKAKPKKNATTKNKTASKKREVKKRVVKTKIIAKKKKRK